MDIILRLFIMSSSIIVFIVVIYMMVRQRLNESNSILWLLIAFVTLTFGFFPGLLNWMANVLGIDYAPSLLFLSSILLLTLIAFKSSIQLSRLESKVSELAMVLSILKEENRRLAARVSTMCESEYTDM